MFLPNSGQTKWFFFSLLELLFSGASYPKMCGVQLFILIAKYGACKNVRDLKTQPWQYLSRFGSNSWSFLLPLLLHALHRRRFRGLLQLFTIPTWVQHWSAKHSVKLGQINRCSMSVPPIELEGWRHAAGRCVGAGIQPSYAWGVACPAAMWSPLKGRDTPSLHKATRWAAGHRGHSSIHTHQAQGPSAAFVLLDALLLFQARSSSLPFAGLGLE